MKPSDSHEPDVADWTFVNASADAEMFCPPSDEAAWLLDRFGDVLAPSRGLGSRASRWVRAFVVAPFTQFTFRSFDLQMFLLDVLHLSWMARMGHLVGMTAVNLWVMALLVALGGPAAGPWVAAIYGVVLLAWYRAVARDTRLWAWWYVMLGLVTALWGGAVGLAALGWPGWAYGIGIVVSGCVVTFPHAAEPMMPPRAGHPTRWMSAFEYVFGTAEAPVRGRRRLYRAVRVATYPWIGLVNEIWASPRLMPYNVLRLMLNLGYAPELERLMSQRRDRAWASGNPALDFVGVGGGTFIRRRRTR